MILHSISQERSATQKDLVISQLYNRCSRDSISFLQKVHCGESIILILKNFSFVETMLFKTLYSFSNFCFWRHFKGERIYFVPIKLNMRKLILKLLLSKRFWRDRRQIDISVINFKVDLVSQFRTSVMSSLFNTFSSFKGISKDRLILSFPLQIK